MHRLRVVLAVLAVCAAGVLVLAFGHERGAAAQPRSCATATFTSGSIVYKVLFAKNGAVQQYVLARGSRNLEKNHDVLKAAQAEYGPEGVNAPPLQILGFKPGPGGMMIPDKAVDSCGRITHMN